MSDRSNQLLPVDEDATSEESILELSGQDREAFLAAIANPPEPTSALIRAAELHRQRVTKED